MKFADFDDWLKPFKDDWPYMTQSGVVGCGAPCREATWPRRAKNDANV